MSTLVDKKHSLTQDILIRMAIRLTLIVIGVTVLTYLHIVSILKQETTDKLLKYIEERANRESFNFQLASSNQQLFKEEFLDIYANLPSTSTQEFQLYFTQAPDQSYRLDNKYFSGYRDDSGVYHQDLSAWISPSAPVDDELFVKKVVVATRMVSEFGRAWSKQANLFVGFPERAATVFWPGVDWAGEVDADYDINVEEWMSVVNMDNNQSREPVWTGLYYEPPSGKNLVSLVTPIDHNGEHLLNVGQDLLLGELFERVINDRLAGTYNFIVRKDGQLIIHPDKIDALQAAQGQVHIDTLDDPMLTQMYQAIVEQSKSGETSFIVEPLIGDAYIAASQITGPDWYFVTVYPYELLQSSARSTVKFILILSLLSLVIEILLLWHLMRSKVTKSIDALQQAAELIAKGEYKMVAQGSVDLPVSREDEIGYLSRVFLQMGKNIYDLQFNMENQVAARTLDLSKAMEDLKATQQQMVDSEKMAALGQLVAGIAHEINTPLGVIKSSIHSITHVIEEAMTKLPKLFVLLSEDEQKLFFQLVYTQEQGLVIRSSKEKRAMKKQLKQLLGERGVENHGQFADILINLGIYETADHYTVLLNHEHNRFIFDMGNKLSHIQNAVSNITVAGDQAGKVVFALKNFARFDHNASKKETNIQENIETVITLYQGQIKQGIELIRDYQQVPLIYCYPDDLSQVWTNLIHNAIQAMAYHGELKISIYQQNEMLVVSVSDNGCGISQADLDVIFKPFYTTKPAGEGSGLGLDIVKKIVAKHDGEIAVESEVGQGTTFYVKLQINDNGG